MPATDRFNQISSLLYNTSLVAVHSAYRILPCHGYIRHTGHLAGTPTPLVGFLFSFPTWADPGTLPVPLHTILSESYASEKATAPALGVRLSLAKQLALSLYSLQCARWLHRKLSNRNVIFFRSKETETLDLSRAFLSGFSSSRPDDQLVYGPSEANGWKGYDIAYVHPTQLSSAGRRYRRSDDVYALGILLLEIAFWEPSQVFERKGMAAIRGLSNVSEVSSTIMSVAVEELPAEMGERYRDVVMGCLSGIRGRRPERGWKNGEWYDGKNDKGDREAGLEVDFFWNVIRELENIRV